MSCLIGVIVAFVAGTIPGLVGINLMVHRSRMFRSLWENEKAGNFIMTKRLTDIETRSEGE